MMRMRLFRWLDAVLIVAVLAVAGLWLLLSRRDAGVWAVVEVDGKVCDRVAFSTLETPVVRTYGLQGQVTVEFSAVGVRVLTSDCAGKQCVHAGTINRTGEQIVCLPCRVCVSVDGAADGEGPDGVTG